MTSSRSLRRRRDAWNKALAEEKRGLTGDPERDVVRRIALCGASPRVAHRRKIRAIVPTLDVKRPGTR